MLEFEHKETEVKSSSKMEKESQKQVIVAMKGHPGTGKTTIATAIAAALNCPLLDKDDVRDSTHSLSHHLHRRLLNDLSYEVLHHIAATQLRLGLSLVIDSPLSRKSHFDRLLHLVASRPGTRLVVVECRPKEEAEWRRRVEERGAAEGASWHKPATWRDVEELLEEYGGCYDYDVGEVAKLVLDTTAEGVGVGEHVSSVLKFIHSSNGRC